MSVNLFSGGNNINSLMAAGKNAVINGGFDIWQRGTSVAGSGASYNYTADRWQITASSALTVTRQPTGDTTNLPFIQYCGRFQRNSGSTSTSLNLTYNSFETVNSIPYAGRTVTLSFYARRGANFSGASNLLNSLLISGTGTDQSAMIGYTGVSDVINQTVTLTTTWQRFTLTGTVPTNSTELAVGFYYTPTGTAGAADYFEITGVQLELGSVATTFARNASTIQGELAACQRYYFRYTGNSASQNPVGTGFALSSTQAESVIPYPTTMRSTPSLSYSAAADITFTWSAGTSSTSSVNPDLGSPQFLLLRINTSGLTTGTGGYYRIETGTTKYIELSAEL